MSELGPSFLGELLARSWTPHARCIDASDLNWTCGTHGGIEPPATVVACMDVCGPCPVRRTCLDDAITERQYTTTGVWGGTTKTERTRALTMARVLAPTDREARRIAGDMLDNTFTARYAMWVARTEGRTPMALLEPIDPPLGCTHCGQLVLFAAPCSKVCRRMVAREERDMRQALEVVA